MSKTSTEAILPSPNTVTGRIFVQHLNGVLTDKIGRSSTFLKKFWDRYPQGQAVVNGNVFEHLVSVLLYRQNIRPLYQQVNIAFVPNVIFDLAVYTEKHGPVVLSLKTSLRERYKQVDLEGTVLKNVHRRARTFLVTADREEARNVNRKIDSHEVQGIEKVIYAFGKDMDDLVFELRDLKMTEPGTADILQQIRKLT